MKHTTLTYIHPHRKPRHTQWISCIQWAWFWTRIKFGNNDDSSSDGNNCRTVPFYALLLPSWNTTHTSDEFLTRSSPLVPIPRWPITCFGASSVQSQRWFPQAQVSSFHRRWLCWHTWAFLQQFGAEHELSFIHRLTTCLNLKIVSWQRCGLFNEAGIYSN